MHFTLLAISSLILATAAGASAGRTPALKPNEAKVHKIVSGREIAHNKVFGMLRKFHPEIFVAKKNKAKTKNKKASVAGLQATSGANVHMDLCLLSADVCPPAPQCGAFLTCSAPPRVVVCQGCDSAYCGENAQYCVTSDTSGPSRVCNFGKGLCAPNNNATSGISGAMCTPEKDDSKCGREHKCLRDETSKKIMYRCCRSQCPPGLFGSPAFSYTNNCGKKIQCPASPN